MTTFSKSLAKGMLLAAAAAAAALYHIHLYHFIRLRAPSHEGTIHVYMLLYYMNASRIERCISVRYINRNLLFVQFFFFGASHWRRRGSKCLKHSFMFFFCIASAGFVRFRRRTKNKNSVHSSVVLTENCFLLYKTYTIHYEYTQPRMIVMICLFALYWSRYRWIGWECFGWSVYMVYSRTQMLNGPTLLWRIYYDLYHSRMTSWWYGLLNIL